MAITNGSGSDHVVVVPLMAQGHLLPAFDMARAFATRGALASVVITPANAAHVRVPDLTRGDLPVRLLELPFPCAEAGLPDGIENVDTTPPHLFANFFHATALLRLPFESRLRNLYPRPTCIVGDVWIPWVADVARELRVPFLLCHWISCFTVLCYHNIRLHGDDIPGNASEPFVVPGLPDRIVATREKAPGFFAWDEGLRVQMAEAHAAADGIVLNSFEELEPEYIKLYREATGKKVWAVGPLCLFGGRDLKSNSGEERCLAWLDAQQPRSVVYVSFGSLAQTRPAQLIEIGEGLEASGSPFIWLVRGAMSSPETDTWLMELEARTKGRGLVIAGWAPQALILAHGSVGGFVTHCGWNSTLEGVSTGLPMVTWPHFADQFMNERLLEQVAGTGVPVGVERPLMYVYDREVEMVKREEVSRAVRRLMEGGKEAEARRRRAEEHGQKARKAVEEGGSSYNQLSQLLDCITSPKVAQNDQSN